MSQRFRVICNGCSFYTTETAIREGIGDFISFNEAVRQALSALESGNDSSTGICGTFKNMQIQLDLID